MIKGFTAAFTITNRIKHPLVGPVNFCYCLTIFGYRHGQIQLLNRSLRLATIQCKVARAANLLF